MSAKDYLKGSITCVAKKGETVYTSDKTGISPILYWLDNGYDLKGFSVADKIVGKAAAALFVKAGITEVYAATVSVHGLEYLKNHGIRVEYGTLTKEIINRSGDGLCPMEQAVLNINDIEKAYYALKQKVEELKVKE